jgi:hypothetical protein
MEKSVRFRSLLVMGIVLWNGIYLVPSAVPGFVDEWQTTAAEAAGVQAVVQRWFLVSLLAGVVLRLAPRASVSLGLALAGGGSGLMGLAPSLEMASLIAVALGLGAGRYVVLTHEAERRGGRRSGPVLTGLEIVGLGVLGMPSIAFGRTEPRGVMVVFGAVCLALLPVALRLPRRAPEQVSPRLLLGLLRSPTLWLGVTMAACNAFSLGGWDTFQPTVLKASPWWFATGTRFTFMVGGCLVAWLGWRGQVRLATQCAAGVTATAVAVTAAFITELTLPPASAAWHLAHLLQHVGIEAGTSMVTASLLLARRAAGREALGEAAYEASILCKSAGYALAAQVMPGIWALRGGAWRIGPTKPLTPWGRDMLLAVVAAGAACLLATLFLSCVQRRPHWDPLFAEPVQAQQASTAPPSAPPQLGGLDELPLVGGRHPPLAARRPLLLWPDGMLQRLGNAERWMRAALERAEREGVIRSTYAVPGHPDERWIRVADPRAGVAYALLEHYGGEVWMVRRVAWHPPRSPRSAPSEPRSD